MIFSRRGTAVPCKGFPRRMNGLRMSASEMTVPLFHPGIMEKAVQPRQYESDGYGIGYLLNK